jgi:deoxycytidine triphosphate deaminase
MEEALDFAKTDSEAAARAGRFKDCDPFPSVERALLSSAEIEDYVRVTAMLHPFCPKDLKSASYQVRAGGEFNIWSSEGLRKNKIIDKNQSILLPANSIAFVQTEPDFRLPNYMAIRFNLRITHVHRGLLLGTGPLVDPGFQGKLLIPLHNLTNEDYEIDPGEALIWIEFTKTTHRCEQSGSQFERLGNFRPFPEDKCWLKPYQYFEKANKGKPIRSSIPDAIAANRQSAQSAQADSKKAAQAAENAKTQVRLFGGIGLFTVAATLITVILGALQIVETSKTLVQSHAEMIGDLKVQNAFLEQKIENLKVELYGLTKDLIQTKDNLDHH